MYISCNCGSAVCERMRCENTTATKVVEPFILFLLFKLTRKWHSFILLFIIYNKYFETLQRFCFISRYLYSYCNEFLNDSYMAKLRHWIFFF